MPNGKKEYQEYFSQLSDEELKCLLKDAGFKIIEDIPGCIFLEECCVEPGTPNVSPINTLKLCKQSDSDPQE